ncbi:hypothetical protein AMS68_007051 [Peltaster fructicola]|uniref:DUF1772 domain-containing protein n=1 Tax=Peltaster fructicola TaxID=286661 RepID=A0A6H0Y3E4_9PEZI|nr:hypothetical protein AMS68_007051 [Peltaster fructicola]
MATPQTFLQTLHVLQAGLAAYGAYQSYVAITLLREYEGITKKAAEWSNEAQFQLDRTRTTQGAGAIAIVASMAGALTLATIPSHLPFYVRFMMSPALLIGSIAARQHIVSFWGPQGGTRVPLPKMGDFNQAQRKTKEVLNVLQWLEWSWVATSFGWGVLGA